MLTPEPTDFTKLPKFGAVPDASKTHWFCAAKDRPAWKGWYDLRARHAHIRALGRDLATHYSSLYDPRNEDEGVKAWWNGLTFTYRVKVPGQVTQVVSVPASRDDEWRGVLVEEWSPYTTGR